MSPIFAILFALILLRVAKGFAIRWAYRRIPHFPTLWRARPRLPFL